VISTNFLKSVSQSFPVEASSGQPDQLSINPTKLIEVEVENGKMSKQILQALLTVQTQLYSMQVSISST